MRSAWGREFNVRRSSQTLKKPLPRRAFSREDLEGTIRSPKLPSGNSITLVTEAGAPSRGRAGHSAHSTATSAGCLRVRRKKTLSAEIILRCDASSAHPGERSGLCDRVSHASSPLQASLPCPPALSYPSLLFCSTPSHSGISKASLGC